MEEQKNEDVSGKAGHRTIFHEIINSPHLSPAEKQPMRVIHEAGSLVAAGGEGVSQMLAALTYCLVTNPEKMKKLRDELRTIMSDCISPIPCLKQLENLPYLVNTRTISTPLPTLFLT